jgi:16S rRNA (guanine966-N2)-methyltransferase
LRIIAGKYRRRKLLANPGEVTRPITDKVKETLFERLGQEIPGSRVADVFAGTGTLGLEALSRGAESAVFIEADRKAHQLLLRNVAALGAEDATLCWKADVLRTSFRPKGVPHFLPFDLIFFDPPYRMIADIQPGSPLYKALERIARAGIAAEDATLVLRTPQKAQFECPAVWKLDRSYDFHNMQIFLYDRQKDIAP